MPYEILDAVGPFIAPLLGIGAFVLIGMQMMLTAKARRQSGVGREEIERLADAVESLTEQAQMVREEVAELQERVDFAERLLSQGREREAAEKGQS